ncbi:TRAP transporter small permease [Marinimicrococcus flavescens]|uniref:TRAP transporter small permease protein n=1 Tax=Marinimicrococcus flavescens TaxID=3031815 RepID=A0AAP3UXC2_9PROT|nr:TRAP transporter small permease [Marinimicrococcus flavescens]
MLDLLRRADRQVFRWSLRLAMALLVVMACVSLWQVISRFLLEQPAAWTEITARSLNVWMVYLGLVATFRAGALISVELLLAKAKGRFRAAVVAAVAGLSLGVLLVMLWFGIDMVQRARFQMLAGIDNPFTGGGISIALVYLAIPVGAALSIVAVVARAGEEIARSLGRLPPESAVIHEV